MKRPVILLLFLLMLLPLAVSCSDNNSEDGRINIVFTAFSPYDWTKQIIKGREDEFTLTLLNDNGTDLHNYQPTVDDMISVEDADLFVYVGGESDEWAKESGTDAETVDMMECLEIKGELHGHGGNECNDDHSEEEHVWLSLPYAMELVNVIEEKISSLDPANEDLYLENARIYTEKLSALYGTEGIERFSEKAAERVVFADRYPFYYMMKDLGVKVSSAFTGCSTESNAAIDTQLMLIEELKENDVRCILVLENSDESIARAVIEQSGKSDCRILCMNSMQSVSREEIDSGMNYYDVMTENIDAVYKALY